jgi:hypothetical protein
MKDLRYWLVVPKNLPKTLFRAHERGDLKNMFYENHRAMQIDFDEVLMILRREGISR